MRWAVKPVKPDVSDSCHSHIATRIKQRALQIGHMQSIGKDALSRAHDESLKWHVAYYLLAFVIVNADNIADWYANVAYWLVAGLIRREGRYLLISRSISRLPP